MVSLNSSFNEASMLFRDRKDAGKKLANLLLKFKNEKSLVLGLPRGGVVVANEVSKKLNLPLNVIISRKIGAPGNPEFGIGAVCEIDTVYLDKRTLTYLGLKKEEIIPLIEEQKQEIRKRIDLFRGGKKLPKQKGRRVFLIDDGLATGATAKAAIRFLRNENVSDIIFGAPVCDKNTSIELAIEVENIVCVLSPDLTAIGSYYDDFSQIEDKEVVKILHKRGEVS